MGIRLRGTWIVGCVIVALLSACGAPTPSPAPPKEPVATEAPATPVPSRLLWLPPLRAEGPVKPFLAETFEEYAAEVADRCDGRVNPWLTRENAGGMIVECKGAFPLNAVRKYPPKGYTIGRDDAEHHQLFFDDAEGWNATLAWTDVQVIEGGLPLTIAAPPINGRAVSIALDIIGGNLRYQATIDTPDTGPGFHSVEVMWRDAADPTDTDKELFHHFSDDWTAPQTIDGFERALPAKKTVLWLELHDQRCCGRDPTNAAYVRYEVSLPADGTGQVLGQFDNVVTVGKGRMGYTYDPDTKLVTISSDAWFKIGEYFAYEPSTSTVFTAGPFEPGQHQVLVAVNGEVPQTATIELK